MIKIPKKNSLMEKLAKLVDDFEEEEIEDLEEEEIEDDDENEPFITRMTKTYNYLVDAIEMMPPSTSKEIKFKKDQDKSKSFYLKLSGIAKDYQKFLNRMRSVT